MKKQRRGDAGAGLLGYSSFRVAATLFFHSLGVYSVAIECKHMNRTSINRKSAPGVSGGRVQKKNNLEWTANYYTTAPPSLVIDRQRPGQGYRHVLMQWDTEKRR